MACRPTCRRSPARSPCGSAASRRRRRPPPAAAPCRPCGSAPGRCTPSIPRALSPFHANTGTPAGGDRRRGVILRREDVAARPAHFGAQVDQRLDQHRGLNGHVQRAGDAHALQRLFRAHTCCGSPSSRASRARQSKFPCGPIRPGASRPLCIRSFYVADRVEVAIQFSLYRRIVIY